MREPETQAVLQALSGALLLLVALVQLTWSDGRALYLLAAAAIASGGAITLVHGVRTYRRLRDEREFGEVDARPKR